MTYRRLIDSLSRIPTDRLDDDVTVFDKATGEFFPATSQLKIADDDKQDVLDHGHAYFEIN